MAKLNILEFPDERLRIKAKPVEQVDDGVRAIIDAMFETMYEASGIGLAGTQVDIHKRIIVMDVSEEKDSPMCFVNPELCSTAGVEQSEEGCLSVPGFFETVERAEKITVRALNREGQAFELEADGLLAVCIQHEMDHLVGKLFVDYLSPLKRQRIRKKLIKSHRVKRESARDRKQAV
ncbi:MAG: peptide deformylase [Methylococcaceae bacterium]|nr:peptide deformylase [Methylococcaceae bacterium]